MSAEPSARMALVRNEINRLVRCAHGLTFVDLRTELRRLALLQDSCIEDVQDLEAAVRPPSRRELEGFRGALRLLPGGRA